MIFTYQLFVPQFYFFLNWICEKTQLILFCPINANTFLELTICCFREFHLNYRSIQNTQQINRSCLISPLIVFIIRYRIARVYQSHNYILVLQILGSFFRLTLCSQFCKLLQRWCVHCNFISSLSTRKASENFSIIFLTL